MKHLLEFPSPFPAEPGLVRLLEPPASDALALAARLLEGRYDKPFVLENGGLRALHFSLGYVQSVMDIDNPAALVLAYAQRMMAFLLFDPRPRRITLLGLGGGSLASFCHHRHLPAADLTALEIDPHVIALRDHFGVPPDDARFRVIPGDGVRWIEDAQTRCDVLLVDAFGAEGVAGALLEADFYEHAHRHLGGRGILVMNVAGERRGLRRSCRPPAGGVRRARDRHPGARGRQPHRVRLPRPGLRPALALDAQPGAGAAGAPGAGLSRLRPPQQRPSRRAYAGGSASGADERPTATAQRHAAQNGYPYRRSICVKASAPTAGS